MNPGLLFAIAAIFLIAVVVIAMVPGLREGAVTIILIFVKKK